MCLETKLALVKIGHIAEDETYGNLPLSGPKYPRSGMSRMPTLDPSTPAELTVFPHQSNWMGLYPTAKNMMSALIATPAVSAADRT